MLVYQLCSHTKMYFIYNFHSWIHWFKHNFSDRRRVNTFTFYSVKLSPPSLINLKSPTYHLMAPIVKKWYFKYYSLLFGEEAAMFIQKLSIWNDTRELMIGAWNPVLHWIQLFDGRTRMTTTTTSWLDSIVTKYRCSQRTMLTSLNNFLSLRAVHMA